MEVATAVGSPLLWSYYGVGGLRSEGATIWRLWAAMRGSTGSFRSVKYTPMNSFSQRRAEIGWPWRFLFRGPVATRAEMLRSDVSSPLTEHYRNSKSWVGSIFRRICSPIRKFCQRNVNYTMALLTLPWPRSSARLKVGYPNWSSSWYPE